MDQCFDLTIVPLMIINIDGDLINHENQHKPEHNWLTVTIIFDFFCFIEWVCFLSLRNIDNIEPDILARLMVNIS